MIVIKLSTPSFNLIDVTGRDFSENSLAQKINDRLSELFITLSRTSVSVAFNRTSTSIYKNNMI